MYAIRSYYVRIKAFRTRAVGFRIAMNKYNIPVSNQFILTLDTTMDGAYRDMCEILKKKTPLPTAFFADNDMIALGAMKAMQEYGIKIPQDVSVIGFDDLPFCEIASPRLTSVITSYSIHYTKLYELEEEGKEATAAHLQEMIDLAKAENRRRN